MRRIYIIGLLAVIVSGSLLRLPFHLFQPGHVGRALVALHPQPMNQSVGFDEHLYAVYANGVIQDGLSSYPDIVAQYRQHQQTLTGSILPPIRFLFIGVGAAWNGIFATDALTSLRDVAAFFSILTLVLTAIFAARLKHLAYALPVTALMAFAPTQLHMSQHALVDGFFTFWAMFTLWLLWENLRSPRDWRWLLPFVLSLSALVLTKENAVFVWIAIIAILVANYWLKFGTITRELLGALVIGPLLGIAILVWLAGGLTDLIATYQLSVSKNYQLKYAILTGDGPWYRYLVDLLLVSPIVLLLAVSAIFRLGRERTVEWFFLIFLAASYLLMCNIKYGMNLRYANMWDLPLRVLAFSQLAALAALLPRGRIVAVAVAVALICFMEFRNYVVLAVNYPLYELVSPELIRALKILK